jgi:hypothetical protein
MFISSSVQVIQRRLLDQSKLVELATADAVRTMHQELEHFYRTQLVALEASERLSKIAALSS